MMDKISTESSIRYKIFKRVGESGKHQFVFKKIAEDPMRDSKRKIVSPKKGRRRSMLQNLRKSLESSDSSEHDENTVKKKTMKKGSEKLNDQRITEMLCNSESVDSEDSDANNVNVLTGHSLNVLNTKNNSKPSENVKTNLRKYSRGKTVRNVESKGYVTDSSEDNESDGKQIQRRCKSNKNNENQTVSRTRYSQRKRISKYDNSEWEVCTPTHKLKSKVNRKSSKSVSSELNNENYSGNESSSSGEPGKYGGNSSVIKKMKTAGVKVDSPRKSSRNRNVSNLKNKNLKDQNSEDETIISASDESSEDKIKIRSKRIMRETRTEELKTANSLRRYDLENKRTPTKNGTALQSLVSTEKVLTPSTKKLIRRTENECTPKGKSAATTHALKMIEKVSPKTPVSGKGGRKLQVLTPSLPSCKRILGTPQTPLQEAMTRLHVSAVPQSLPCREAEFANVHRFLKGKILDCAGGCIYISGVPGTGKTATVREVVRSLKHDVEKDEIPNFQFIEVNGMRLSHPRQVYVSIWKALSNESVTAEQAQRLLEKRFTRSSIKNISVVLLVDEVDVLWTRRQDVIYNLLDWPTKAKSQLIVITIANTMDLPERLLMGRVTSRLGLTRLTFQPYSHKQLEEIVKARLLGIEAFDPDAVQFVSRKVASVSGDARRALDICRRATEIAEQESPDALVTIKHVDEAIIAMTSSQTVQAIEHACSTIEKLFLQAVDAELNRTGLEETTFSEAYKMLETLCSLEGLTLPCASIVMRSCMKLSCMRLLLSQNSSMDVYSRIFLNISSDDLHYALKYKRKK